MNTTNIINPVFLLAGGRLSGITDMAAMLSRAFGPIQKPLVAYIGAANGDNIVFSKMMKTLLMKAGAGKVEYVKLASEKADIKAARDKLSRSDVVFISGGEVDDGMNWLKKHELVDYLKELYSQNKRFVGVSAGSIMLGAHWVRWSDPDDDGTSELFDCIGIIPLVFDTHAEDEDWKELKAALKLMGDGARGYGIPIGGMVSADGGGALVNEENTYLTYVNDNGNISKI